MIAHKIQDFDNTVANTSTNMSSSQIHLTSRLVSAPYDEQHADLTHVVSCSSDEDPIISITGKFSNIEHKYHIDPRVLGTGHHGSVRECIDRCTGQRCAVKSICKSDPSVKPGGLTREIMLLKEMKHRNIVQLIDVYEDEHYVHLVTDLCEGGELFDKIVEKSSCENGAPCFTESEAARMMYQILNAVSYMHKRGVAHRDLKPENILFETQDGDSQVKIIDFGLSRKHSSKERPMSTIVGTPYYIAPEVLRKQYSKSCDLWSVGVIAYILLCGYPPFNGAGNDETHKAVLRGNYCFPGEDWKDISHEAMDFIYRLLQVDPQRRMTVEQALNHPWIVNHVRVNQAEEECQQNISSVEIVYTESPKQSRKHLVLPCGGQSPPRRKARM